MNPKEIGCKDAEWINLAHGREQQWALVCTVMNLRVPSKAGDSWTK
jgi:hypothetical protein